MDDVQYRERCRQLPIFPLPRTVLLPNTSLTLHVFEPRYRALVAHCLERDGILGIATLKPGFEEDYGGSPALFPELGVGQIVGHQPYPDGRSNIVLRSIGSAHLEEELQLDTPFRIVRGSVPPPNASGLEAALQGLRVLVLQLGGLSRDASEEARRLIQLDGMQLVDALAKRLLEGVDEQRAYLGAARLADRVALVQDRLARFLLPSQIVGEA